MCSSFPKSVCIDFIICHYCLDVGTVCCKFQTFVPWEYIYIYIYAGLHVFAVILQVWFCWSAIIGYYLHILVYMFLLGIMPVYVAMKMWWSISLKLVSVFCFSITTLWANSADYKLMIFLDRFFLKKKQLSFKITMSGRVSGVVRGLPFG